MKKLGNDYIFIEFEPRGFDRDGTDMGVGAIVNVLVPFKSGYITYRHWFSDIATARQFEADLVNDANKRRNVVDRALNKKSPQLVGVVKD